VLRREGESPRRLNALKIQILGEEKGKDLREQNWEEGKNQSCPADGALTPGRNERCLNPQTRRGRKRKGNLPFPELTPLIALRNYTKGGGEEKGEKRKVAHGGEGEK